MRIILVNTAVAQLFSKVSAIFKDFQAKLDSGFTNKNRQAFMDSLGAAITKYRSTIYQDGIPESQSNIPSADLHQFLSLAQSYIDQTLKANLRDDHLAHTYNILNLDAEGAGIENLYLMLEGQVSILSSGVLPPAEAVTLLQNLRQSNLYRADQHSYMLYPNRKLANFQQKNNVSPDQVSGSPLVEALSATNDMSLLSRDVAGVYHFNGRFRNRNDVINALDTLAENDIFAELVSNERDFILDLFEDTFNHRAFTGRSGTFFAYEGLGSIYWHMVSKLLLAVQESYQQAEAEGCDDSVCEALSELYYDVRAGIGFNKSPDVYGAFPTDPYSHTPMGSGARQPGMTGQVKEEILTRWGELGIKIENGMLSFAPTLLQIEEFLGENQDFSYVNTAGVNQTLSLAPGSLAFTFCQVPIIYQRGAEPTIEIETVMADGRSATILGNTLDKETTQHIFDRDGQVKQLCVTVPI